MRSIIAASAVRWRVAKALSKMGMEGSSSRLAFAECHICVEVPDIPTIGDRHVASIGPAIDHDDAIFAEQAIIAGIVDEARNKKFLLRSFLEISADRGAVVDLCQSGARV